MRRFIITTCLSLSAFVYVASPAWAGGPVTIPPNYAYDPTQGSLHDYCTTSQDQPVVSGDATGIRADFRGPCSRHDLCYGEQSSKGMCDYNFRRDMLAQCTYQFGDGPTGLLRRCNDLANDYFDAVSRFGEGNRLEPPGPPPLIV